MGFSVSANVAALTGSRTCWLFWLSFFAAAAAAIGGLSWLIQEGLSDENAREVKVWCWFIGGAFSRFILDAHGIRWFKSVTHQSGWMTESLSQDTGFDGLVLHLDTSCESVEGAFSRFILDAHGIRWFKSATRQSGWMTESLSQDTGFIGPVHKVMESRAGSIDASGSGGLDGWSDTPCIGKADVFAEMGRLREVTARQEEL
ncbi:hypothetical protein QJS10_CPA16g00585 [Acorus calamus]|uniref:Uncharacterized protein n=1 Tax=Acorus calamus TaxID=4465 RepID=A0AAV9CZA3_ACOCL|nr:hypothetical protein QJS10_CPA16g00585 [Acorus calamus]